MKVTETKLGLMKKTAIKTSGFTIIELLITVLVAAILLALAVPALDDLIRRNRMDAESQRLVGLLAQARSTAVTSGRPAYLCRTEQLLAQEAGNETYTCSTGEGLGWATDILVYNQLANSPTFVESDDPLVTQLIEALEPDVGDRQQMVVAVSEEPGAAVTVVASRNDVIIRFNGDGTLQNTTPFRIGICEADEDEADEFGRIVEISAGGQIRSSVINPDDESRGCEPNNDV